MPASAKLPRRRSKRKPLRPLDPAWFVYQTTRSVALRNQLVERYLPLARAAAEKMAGRLPGMVDVDDLFAAASLGLVHAVERFDPDVGCQFSTFAAPRMHGAMVDELRAQDHLPRLIRTRQRLVEHTRRTLAGALQRPPTDADVAEALGLPLAEVAAAADGKPPVSLYVIQEQHHEEALLLIDTLVDARAPDPTADRLGLIADFCRGLSQEERLIVLLYYVEGQTMHEIAETLDLSESRVSQMHTQLLARWRRELGVAAPARPWKMTRRRERKLVRDRKEP